PEADPRPARDPQAEPGRDPAGEVDVARRLAADVRVEVRALRRLRDGVRAERLHEVGGRRRSGRGRRDHAEGCRIAGLVDARRRDDLHAEGNSERLLEAHEPRVGAAGVSTGLRQLVRDLGLQLFSLLLLALRALLLALELDLLRLQ